MSKQDNKSSIKSDIAGLTVGVTTGVLQYQKTTKSKINNFIPTLDPRSNIVNKIQSINVESLYEKAIKGFQTDYAIEKVNQYQKKIELLHKLGRAQFVSNINDIRGALQENLLSTSSKGFHFTSHSPVLNLSKSTFNKITNAALLESNRSLIQSEWQAAINATFPNPLEAKIFSSETNPFESIRTSLRNNQSTLMQRAFYTFERNVDKLLGMNITTALSLDPVSNFMDSTGLGQFSNAIPDIRNTRLMSTISSIETALNQKLHITHRGLIGQGELAFTLPGGQNPLFTLPEAFSPTGTGPQGLIRTGAGLQNIYAPGLFSIADETGKLSEQLTYPEYKAQRILDTIMKNNLEARTPGLENFIGNTSQQVAKLAEYIEPNISGTNFSLEALFNSNQLTVLDKQGTPITGESRRQVAKNLYERGITPAGAGSKFLLTPEEELYGPLASIQDYSRKPWQFIRKYSPTTAAQEAMKNNPLSTGQFDFLDSPLAVKTFNGPSGARLKTLYLNEDQLAQLRDAFGITIGDGELLIHEQMKKQLQVSRIKRINLHQINTEVTNLMRAGGVKLDNLNQQVNLPNLKYEGILGRSAEGALVNTRYPTELIGLSPNAIKNFDQSTTSSLDLLIRETVNMSDAEKVFGGLKGMARFVQPDTNLLHAMSTVTGKSIEELSDVTAFARIGDVKDEAKKSLALISNFIVEANKAGVTVDATDLLQQAKSLNDSNALENILAQRAADLGFKTSLSLSNKTGGIGVTQVYFGGEKSLTGAGNIGTLEPRIFTLLGASNPGGMGTELSSDLLQRIIQGNPEAVTMHQELMKTLGSIEGRFTPPEGALVLQPKDLYNKSMVESLQRKGGFISTGVEQIPQIYMPGYETVAQLHPRKIGTGAIVDTSQPGKIFKNIIQDIKGLHRLQDPMSHEEFLERFAGKAGHLTQLFQETAIAGHGAGSLASGKLAGSRGLTVLSEINPVNQSAFSSMLKGINDVPNSMKERIIGIPKTYAAEMFAEMEQAYGVEAMKSMKERFFSGNVIAGMGMRHPTIGAYSMQPVLFKAIDESDSVMLVPENMRSITIGGPAGSVTERVQTGILPGLAADKDADTALAILMSPNMESKMRAQLLDEQSTLAKQMQSFRDHSIRMQLLKPKAVAGLDTGISLADRRAAEATKLALTKEEVGILSTSLTRSRVAVMASNIDDSRKLRALSLLEWLEQQPISGKHVAVKQALSGMFETQLEAVKMGAEGNASLLEGAIASMTEGINPVLKPLFQEGADVEGLGRIEGLRVRETTQDIANTIQEFKALPEGSQLAAASKFAAPSRGASITLEQLPHVLMANQIAAPNVATSFSRNIIANINNQLGNIIEKGRPFAKPLALGALAAGVTMAVLGSTPGNLPAPEGVALSNHSRDDIEIPGVTKQNLGQPTATPQLAAKVQQLDSQAQERRKSLRAMIKTNSISTRQREQLVNRINGRYPNSQINIRLQDDRKSMNPHAISDMIS